jgi:glycerol-3-phosphate dehydrogenase (NAD(P)+)
VYFGSRESETAQELAYIFRNDYYHVWSTNDVEGLEISVALKNAYALGVGIAAGMLERAGGMDSADAYMHNLAAALFARSCMEIAIILGALGVRREFAFGLPGIGDLYVTSQGGRSVTVGRLLGEGKTFKDTIQILAGETLEAVMIIQQMSKALPIMYQKESLKQEQLPFMNMLVDVITREKSVELKLDQFFRDVIISSKK